MNNLSNNSTISTADDLGVQKFLVPAFTVWTVTGLANSLASICIVLVMVVWKTMKKDTLWLVVHMGMMEAVGGAVNSGYGCFHLFMASTNEQETRTVFNCWLISSWDMLATSVIGVLYLEISLDRFYAAVFPISYKNRTTKYYLYFFSFVPWLVAALVFCNSVPFVIDNTNLVPVCILKYSLGLSYFRSYSIFMFTLSVAAVSVYAITIVILKITLIIAVRSGGNVAEVTGRINNKATKTLAFTTMAHLFTFTLAASGTEMVTFFEPLGGQTVGPYFYAFYHLGSISSLPIYYACQSKFRTGFQSLCKKIMTMSGSSVVNQIHPQI